MQQEQIQQAMLRIKLFNDQNQLLNILQNKEKLNLQQLENALHQEMLA